MKRMSKIAQGILLAGLVCFFAGCSAKHGVFDIGVINMPDKDYHWKSVSSQDKNGINSNTSVCISENKKGDSKLEYAATGYQTGIHKAMTEQVIPALAEGAKGALIGPVGASMFPATKITTTVTGAGATQIQGQGMSQGQGQGQIQ